MTYETEVAAAKETSQGKKDYEDLKARQAEKRKNERQIEKVEEEIEGLESRIDELEKELYGESSEGNYEKTLTLAEEVKALKEQLDNALEDWEGFMSNHHSGV